MRLEALNIRRLIRRRIDGWIASHNPPSGDRIHLHNRRLYILPTRFGYLFAFMLFFLFLAAINYQNSMAFVLTFMLTALGIISLWQTHKNLLNLHIEFVRPEPVFTGELCELKLKLSQQNNNIRYAIGCQYENLAPAYASLQIDKSEELTISLKARHRGQFITNGFTVFTRYPTGLFHAWGWLKFETPVLVYPKPLSRVVLNQTMQETTEGEAATSTIEGDDFAGLREHREGESLRHVSWKAYAQGKGLLTKTFQGHAKPSLWIDFDQAPNGSLDMKLSYMTALVLSAENQSQKYGLKFPGTLVEQNTGLSHKLNCLKQIATYQQTDLNSILPL